MDFEYAKTEDSIVTANIALKTVYKVNADSTYDIYKQIKPETKEIIALRTTNGKGDIVFKNESIQTVSPHTLIFFKLNNICRYYCSDTTWKFWWFSFEIGGSLNLPFNEIINISDVDNENSMFELCLHNLHQNDFGAKALSSASLEFLIYQWLAKYYELKYLPHPYKKTIDHIINYIYKNLSKDIKIDDLANIAGLSGRRFRQVFKEVTGLPPKKFYNQTKLNMAAELLKNTTLSIGEISSKLAFTNQFYFSKVFNKYYKIPPSEYRKHVI